MANAFGPAALRDAAVQGDLDVCRRLLDQNADPNQANTALYLASSKGFVKVVHLLLDRNADPNKETTHRSTALHVAAHGGYVEVVRLLLGRDADPNTVRADKLGAAALYMASSRGQFRPCRIFHLRTCPLITAQNHLQYQDNTVQCVVYSSILQSGHGFRVRSDS